LADRAMKDPRLRDGCRSWAGARRQCGPTAARRTGFCSEACREKFVATRSRYAGPAASVLGQPRRAHPPSGPVRCTPQIVRDEPGSCPDLRHGLEPMNRYRRRGTQSRARRHDAAVLDRSGAHGAAAGVHGQCHAAGEPLRHLMSPRVSRGCSCPGNAGFCSGLGWPFFVRGLASIINRSLNMFTSSPRTGGVLDSVPPTVAPGLFPESFPRSRPVKSSVFERSRHHSARAAWTDATSFAPRSQTKQRHQSPPESGGRRRHAVSVPTHRRDVPLEAVQVGDRFACPSG